MIEGQETAHFFHLPRQFTIFSAEAFAIKSALEIMWRDRKKGMDIIILTDSQSVLQAVNNYQMNVYNNRYITEIRNIYFKLSKEMGNKIMLIWIPAHQGIRGNELADKIAKEATEEKESIEIEIPIKDLTKNFKKETWIKTRNTLTYESRYKGIDYTLKNSMKKKKKNHGLQS